MKKVLMTFSAVLLSQAFFCQDTTFLKTVEVNHHSLKNSKPIKIKRGFHKIPFFDLTKDFTVYDYYQKIEFPLGKPLDVSLFFGACNPALKDKNKKVLARTFHIDLFHVNNDGSIGSKINTTPFEVKIPESINLYKSTTKNISLLEYNLFVDALYIKTSDPNPIKPEIDVQYWPIGYGEENSPEYRILKNPSDSQSSSPQYTLRYSKLRFKMKILTSRK